MLKISKENDPSKSSVETNMHQNEIAVIRMSGNFSGVGKSPSLNKGKFDPTYPAKEEFPIFSGLSLRKTSKSTSSLNSESSSTIPSNRFNPFNRGQYLSDDEDNTSQTNSEFTSTSDGSGDVSLAELGLTEDYFAHPESLFGMSSVEELEVAIDNCKRMILELPEHSERRKKFTKKLIELRIRLQELKEGPEEIEPKVKTVLAHRLRKRNSSSMKYYCDCCNNLIWGMLQVWYRCKECGFNCHSKCVNMIRRECIAVGIKGMSYELRISPEVGLSTQGFHCAECKNSIAISGDGKEEARLCDYSGQYFCPQCHWNDALIIPSRVLHNWDFSKQNVSRKSYQLLNKLISRPLLNVKDINPMLFNYVEELSDIRKLREDIILMKAYFMTCSSALELKLLHKLKDRQHFVDSSDTYSLKDLIETREGTLTSHLTDIHASFAKHIKLDCPYCQAKGFICEICNSGETLFPFDFGVATCTKCNAVFHRDCFAFIDTLCPRCERKQKKKMKIRSPIESQSESDHETDYMADLAPAGKSPDDLEKSKLSKDESLSESQESVVEADQHQPVRSKKITPPLKILPRKNDPKSLHLLLTDSSYTDYALLGFAGAGKSRKSLPKPEVSKSFQSGNYAVNASNFISDFHSSISDNIESHIGSDTSSFGNRSMSREKYVPSTDQEITKEPQGPNPFEDDESNGNPFRESANTNPFLHNDYDEELNPFS